MLGLERAIDRPHLVAAIGILLVVMGLCGILWRLGGWSDGHKLFRRIGVPLTVCAASILFGVSWWILLALPFMVWIAPSYGENSWLFRLIKNDFVTRLITYGWYWAAFAGVYVWT